MNRMNQQQLGNQARFYEQLNTGSILKEKIREPIYSKKAFAVTAAQTIPFYRDHASGNSLESNLVTNGTMPSQQKFELEGFSVRLDYGMAKADVIKFYNSAVLTFKMSDKTYLKVPLSVVPSGGGLTGLAALALDGASSAVSDEFVELSNGVPSPMSFYPVIRSAPNGVAVPILISPQQSFEVEIQTFASANFSAIFNATVFMHGQRSRESQ